MVENVQIKASTLLIPKDVVILAWCRKFCHDPVRCCILHSTSFGTEYEFESSSREAVSRTIL